MTSAVSPGGHFETIFRSERLRVGRWSCTAPAAHSPSIEHTVRHEVVIPLSGAFVRHLGSRRIFADPNQILFSVPGEEYRTTHPTPTPDRCAVFVLDADLVQELKEFAHDHGATGGAFGRPSGCLAPALFLQQRLLLWALAAGATDELQRETVFTSLLPRLVYPDFPPQRRTARRSRTAAAHRAAVETVQAILVTDPACSLTLDALARRVLTSPFHLSRLFAEHTGLPIHRYRMRLRLRHALDEVIDGRRQLTEIALASGFASHSHFTDAFRREFGVTPSSVREAPRPAQVRRLRTGARDLPSGPDR